MRICTITCSNTDNYGARLQTYALARYLRILGNDVQVIDYRPPYMDPSYNVFYWPGLSLKEWAKFFLRFPQRVYNHKRHQRFVSFSKHFIPLSETVYHSIQELKRNPPEADIYIAGSDQIWNTTLPNGTDPAYYLDFGPDSIRRESYAASFATQELRPGTEDFVKEHLGRFDRITVRERSGLKILEHLGYCGERVEDPVFLLSPENWEEVSDETGAGEKYLLIYDFFSDKQIRQKAKELAKANDLLIYSISPYYLSYADKNYLTSGPETFLGLIKNATMMVTNSFHAIAFSKIYNHPFVFIERPDGLNERMWDFLDR